MPTYSIARHESVPPAVVNWHSPYWSKVRPLTVARFHPNSSRHHPLVQAKVVHSSTAIHILFRVEDHHVGCEKTESHTYVCQDSCVEAFLQPFPDKGYFNFEMNCGGVMLLYYVVDSDRMGPKGDGYTRFSPEEMAQIKLTPSITEAKPYKITGPITWTLQCSIPIAVMEKYVGPLQKLDRQHWRGNFFKCADWTKYPHWASWAPVGAKLWFHQKSRFGELYFRSRVEGE